MSNPGDVNVRTNGAKSEILDRRFVEAVHNSVRHVKRSLLDFLDIWVAQVPPDVLDRTRPLVEMLKRRIHNDVSNIRDQIDAAFEIYKSGGVIPAFGRTFEELDAAGKRDHATREGQRSA